MKKFITIVIVVLILAFGAVFEQITINNYLDEIQDMTYELMTLTKGSKNIQTEEIAEKVSQLKNTWIHHENVLCTFANHKDMRDLCIEIQKLEGNIEVNQYEDFTASLKVIYHLADDYHKIMGTSWQNIF